MIKKCNYVGIDISKLSFDVAFKNDKNLYVNFKFDNDIKGFKSFLKLLKQENIVCVMEASGPYYLNLATFLYDKNFGVSVINPLIIRRFCQMRMTRTKTDKKDAQMIAEYGITETPALWEPESDYVLELKQMQAFVEQLNKSRTGFLRQNEAFKYNSAPSKVVKKGLEDIIKSIEKEIRDIEDKMEIIINLYHKDMLDRKSVV